MKCFIMIFSVKICFTYRVENLQKHWLKYLFSFPQINFVSRHFTYNSRLILMKWTLSSQSHYIFSPPSPLPACQNWFMINFIFNFFSFFLSQFITPVYNLVKWTTLWKQLFGSKRFPAQDLTHQEKTTTISLAGKFHI